MSDWLHRVLGGNKSAAHREKKTPATPASPPAPPVRDATAHKQAQAYLARVQAKISKLADDFAGGAINREQFQKLYGHYQNEIRTINTLIASAPDSDKWKGAVTEGQSLFIRREAMAKARGYAIYKNESGMPLSTLGDFELDSALVVPMLSSYRAATKEIFGGGMRSTAIEGGDWLCFVPGEFTTMMALFSAEPAGQQLQFLDELHRVFEQANRNRLETSPIDADALIFPHEYFLGAWKK